ISDVAQRMMNDASRLNSLAGGGVQDGEQADVSKLFGDILKSAGQSSDQWSDGERMRLIKGALKFVGADQDPGAQGHALKDSSKLVKTPASDDPVGGGQQPHGNCGCDGKSDQPAEANDPSDDSNSCGCDDKFTVNGNTVDTGRYTIS